MKYRKIHPAPRTQGVECGVLDRLRGRRGKEKGKIDMTDGDSTLLNQYLASEKSRLRRKSTFNGVKSKLGKLSRFLDETGLRLAEMSPTEAQSFQGFLAGLKTQAGNVFSRNHVATLMTVVYRFYRWLKGKGVVASNPFKDIRRVRMDKMLPRNLLKPKEMDQLLEELANFNQHTDLNERINRYRVHVAAELMYSTGLRVNEACAIKEGDIDFERATVRVRDSKTGRWREVFLNEYALSVLKLYTSKIKLLIFKHFNHKLDNLFGVTPERLTLVVNEALQKTCAVLKLPPLRSHGFRHSFGYHMLHAGCDIRYIQAFLGHECLKNTQIYTRVDKEDLREMIDRYHPRQMHPVENPEDERGERHET